MSLFSDDVYIGSTTKELDKRLKAHEYNYKCFILDDKQKFMTSYLILKHGNYDILLIENVRAETKDELLIREKYYILNTPNTINKGVPKRTKEEKKEKIKHYGKKYREENKEEIKDKIKNWRETNKEEIKIKKKEYYEEKKEEFMTKQKEYYEKNKYEIHRKGKEHRNKNKDKISEKKKLKFTCSCGSELRFIDKARHERSNKHKNYINHQEESQK